MKKIFAIMLSLTMMVALFAGCSSPANNGSSGSDTSGSMSGSMDKKIKIGIVQIQEHPSLDEIRNAFLAELEAQGYGSDKVDIDYQSAQGDMTTVNSICQKFVGDKVDLIVAIATPSALGAAAATSEIPILFSAVTDPVGAELVASLEKPDGNITGTSDAIPVNKIFELAKELTPDAKTFGLIYNMSEPNSATVIAQAKEYMDANNYKYVEAAVTNSGEVQQAIQSLVGRVDAIFLPIDNTVAFAMTVLSEEANKAKIPVYVSADSMVADGGLATVGVNYTNLGKKTGEMAAQVLNGTAIADIPVAVLDDLNTVVNSETAKAIGVDVSKYAK